MTKFLFSMNIVWNKFQDSLIGLKRFLIYHVQLFFHQCLQQRMGILRDSPHAHLVCQGLGFQAVLEDIYKDTAVGISQKGVLIFRLLGRSNYEGRWVVQKLQYADLQHIGADRDILCNLFQLVVLIGSHLQSDLLAKDLRKQDEIELKRNCPYTILHAHAQLQPSDGNNNELCPVEELLMRWLKQPSQEYPRCPLECTIGLYKECVNQNRNESEK